MTSVVPAPSLLRVMSNDSTRSESMAREAPADAVPEVTVTTSSPSGDKAPQRFQPLVAGPLDGPGSRASLAKRPAPLFQKARPDETARYVTRLGIDPALLEGRSSDIDSVLNDFGSIWEKSKEKDQAEFARLRKPDEVEASLKRELSRVEAGSWLGSTSLEGKDERVGAVERLLDKAIAECDELQGLLTLYSVELSVRLPALLLSFLR